MKHWPWQDFKQGRRVTDIIVLISCSALNLTQKNNTSENSLILAYNFIKPKFHSFHDHQEAKPIVKI